MNKDYNDLSIEKLKSNILEDQRKINCRNNYKICSELSLQKKEKHQLAKESENIKKEREEKRREEIDIIAGINKYYVDLFIDQYIRPYIAIKIKDHVEILGLDSQRFKNWLFRFFYEKTGELITISKY